MQEALEQKTLRVVFAGDRKACREVLAMIARREAEIGRRGVRRLVEACDPDNAYEALRLLEIADLDPHWADHWGETRLLLEPWAVQAALDRRGHPHSEDGDVSEIRRCARDAHALRWPRPGV